ncbi:hypothetical protein, partial [Acinetobacter baumannii]|uniref:hypothetical protein n=1 Tax=Acinetobacter baumannii TaxID=470 RepID=UPI0018A33590
MLLFVIYVKVVVINACFVVYNVLNFLNYTRLNLNSCYNLFVILNLGQKVALVVFLADRPSSDWGELELCQNIHLAILPSI